MTAQQEKNPRTKVNVPIEARDKLAMIAEALGISLQTALTDIIDMFADEMVEKKMQILVEQHERALSVLKEAQRRLTKPGKPVLPEKEEVQEKEEEEEGQDKVSSSKKPRKAHVSQQGIARPRIVIPPADPKRTGINGPARSDKLEAPSR